MTEVDPALQFGPHFPQPAQSCSGTVVWVGKRKVHIGTPWSGGGGVSCYSLGLELAMFPQVTGYLEFHGMVLIVSDG